MPANPSFEHWTLPKRFQDSGVDVEIGETESPPKQMVSRREYLRAAKVSVYSRTIDDCLSWAKWHRFTGYLKSFQRVLNGGETESDLTVMDLSDRVWARFRTNALQDLMDEIVGMVEHDADTIPHRERRDCRRDLLRVEDEYVGLGERYPAYVDGSAPIRPHRTQDPLVWYARFLREGREAEGVVCSSCGVATISTLAICTHCWKVRRMH